MEDWIHLQDIKATLSENLSGKLIGLCVTGSIACVETHRLARLLIRHGATVQIFLTRAAGELVSPKALAWSTGRPVIQDLTARCEHLEFFSGQNPADLLLLAPATANTLGKMAAGIDDNVVMTCLTTAAGNGIPILCAPGMHEPMMRNPAVLRSMKLLEEDGVEFLQPTLAEGKQKMMSSEEIVARVMRRLGPGELQGKKVLITGGPTREFLDPARCLTNPSSGLTAVLLAEEAYRRGGDVVLVYGPGKVDPPSWICTEKVVTSEQMLKACMKLAGEKDIDFVVAAAAVSDFRPLQSSETKRPTSEGSFQLSLEVTPKILRALREALPQARVVGFKASSSTEDEALAAQASGYLESGTADIVVANSIVEEGLGFESPRNRYLVCGPGTAREPLGPDDKGRLIPKLWNRLLV